MSFWLTYHWAHPEPDDLPWHIYRKTLTKRDDEVCVGDGVLFFVGRPPTLAGTRLREAVRVHWGKRQSVPLSKLEPGVACAATVTCERRKIAPADIVYDYGNLPSWEYLTPCGNPIKGGPIGLREVHRVLGARIPPQSFGLWPLKPEQHQELFEMLAGRA